MTGLGVFTHSLGAGLCVKTPAPRWPDQTLELWRAFQRRKRRYGDVPTATSSSSARGSARRGALPRPTARCALPTAAGCCAHCLPTLCPADPLHRTRFAAKRASTSACCRSSASSSPTTSRRSIMLYYREVPPRMCARRSVEPPSLVRPAFAVVTPSGTSGAMG